MRITSPVGHLSTSQDLSTRSRLRNAAIECFAVDGFDVSVRTIAARAGVSAGLIRHHYGSKETLHAECDSYVLATVRAMKADTIADPSPSAMLAQLAQIEDYAAFTLYILRSVRHGGATGNAFLSDMIEDAHAYTRSAVEAGILRPSRNPEARVRMLVTESLGGLILALSLEPIITTANVGEVMRRLLLEVTLPRLELYTEGLLTDRSMLDDYLLYMSDPPKGQVSPPRQRTHSGPTEEHP